MRRKAEPVVAASGLDVEFIDLPGESIPLETNSVDTVLVTYTLCSIVNAVAALEGMRRVLKPGGSLLYCEHGIAPDAGVRKWQHRLNSPWRSVAGGCNMNRDIPELISQGGFEALPYVVPRFLKATGEVMGRSPAMTALPDVKMLNLMSKTIIQAAQKQIDPPLLVPDDGFLLPIRTQPGGLNFFRSGSRETITPLNTGANIPIGLNMEEQRRTAIRQAFYVDQILTAGSPQMTATEVIQRQEERMRVIGPVLGRLMNEMLRPLIDRVFALMLRNDMLAPAPEILQGRDIDIEYVSPLARAQKSSSLNNTMRALEILLPLAQSLPVGDHIDPDGLVRHVTDSLGVPKATLRSQREVNETREARAQAEQEAMQRQRDQEDVYTTAQAAQAVRMVQS